MALSPCQGCPDPALCRRLGRHIKGRLWELWTCACPPERPCKPERCAAYRADWEAKAPGPLSRLRRLAGFLAACWRHVRHGLPSAGGRDQAFRRAACNGCFFRVPETDECSKCGCSLGGGRKLLPAKITWAQEQCPEGYWGPVPGETAWARAWRWLRERPGRGPA